MLVHLEWIFLQKRFMQIRHWMNKFFSPKNLGTQEEMRTILLIIWKFFSFDIFDYCLSKWLSSRLMVLHLFLEHNERSWGSHIHIFITRIICLCPNFLSKISLVITNSSFLRWSQCYYPFLSRFPWIVKICKQILYFLFFYFLLLLLLSVIHVYTI